MSMILLKAIFLPSGDQTSNPVYDKPLESFLRPLPLGLITKIPLGPEAGAAEPGALLAGFSVVVLKKAIFLPSGDQANNPKLPSNSAVSPASMSLVWLAPSACITYRSVKGPAAMLPLR